MKNILFAPDGDPGGQGGGDDDSPDTQGLVEPPEGTDPDEKDLVPRSDLQRVNREAAKYRRERNDLQNRLKQFEDAEKTEIERLSGENKTLSDRLSASEKRERALRVEVMATRVGVTPEARADAVKLLDWDKIEDPDNDQMIEDALKDLVKERPYLRGAVGGADGGAGTGGRSTSTGMNERIRAGRGR